MSSMGEREARLTGMREWQAESKSRIAQANMLRFRGSVAARDDSRGMEAM